jgi:hypothetical protein
LFFQQDIFLFCHASKNLTIRSSLGKTVCFDQRLSQSSSWFLARLAIAVEILDGLWSACRIRGVV